MPELCCVHVACCQTPAAQHSPQAPWPSSAVPSVPVLEEGHGALRAHPPWWGGRETWQVLCLGGMAVEARRHPPLQQVLGRGAGRVSLWGFEFGCVCASFFCGPHRCYENLHSPAGKVTSARLLLPTPQVLQALQPVGGLPPPTPAAPTATSHCVSSSLLFPSPPCPCAPFSVLPERCLGGVWQLAWPLTSV